MTSEQVELLRDLVERTPTNLAEDRALQSALEAIERDRVRGVLDGFCRTNEGSHRTSPLVPSGEASCQLMWWRPNKVRSKTFTGRDADEARSRAADAITKGKV